MSKNDILKQPVDVICYGKKHHYETREEAVKFFLDCMHSSEGAERERYTNIYFELLDGISSVVSDGEPEMKLRDKGKEYTIDDKYEIIDKVRSGNLSINSPELYDIRKGGLQVVDRDIMMAFLERDGWYAAQYLRKYIADDRELIKAACLGGREKSDALVYASEELRNDKEFVLELIEHKSSNFKHVSAELANDAEVVFVALNNVKSDLELKIVKEKIGLDLLVSLLDERVSRSKKTSQLDKIIESTKTDYKPKKENVKSQKER